MSKSIYFFLIILLYFLIVYFIAIRRMKQKLISWILVIVIQALSFYFFKDLVALLQKISLFAQLSNTLCIIIVTIALTTLNLFCIISINYFLMEKSAGSTDADVVYFDVTDSSLPEINLQVDLNNMEQAVSPETPPDKALVPKEQISNASSLQNEKKIFATIQILEESGQYQEAMKYLRLATYFGNNPEIVAKAKSRLDDLQKKINAEGEI